MNKNGSVFFKQRLTNGSGREMGGWTDEECISPFLPRTPEAGERYSSMSSWI